MPWLIFILFLCMQTVYANSDIHPFSRPADAVRFAALTKEIRCVVCQNQSIADSNAPLANDLRQKVWRMVSDNQSDSEIKNYLVERYGEFILLQPRFSSISLILWLFPLLVSAFITMILYSFFRRR